MRVLKSIGVLLFALAWTIGGTWASGVEGGTIMGLLWGFVAAEWLTIIWWRSES